MSNHAKGYQRDRLILTAIEKHGALNTDQVTELFFPGKNGKRIAQRRLRRLCDTGSLKRCRVYGQPYVYFIGKRPGMLEHRIGLNWVYVWTVRNLAKWETLERWNYEEDYGLLRPDAVMAIRNSFTKEYRVAFVEFDNSPNDFDKVAKYNAFYASEKYLSCWWYPHVDRFPSVLIVSVSRADHIRRKVESENTHGIRFEVKDYRGVV